MNDNRLGDGDGTHDHCFSIIKYLNAKPPTLKRLAISYMPGKLSLLIVALDNLCSTLEHLVIHWDLEEDENPVLLLEKLISSKH
jgi:hypothetical protein